jgi:hypothetical protein
VQCAAVAAPHRRSLIQRLIRSPFLQSPPAKSPFGTLSAPHLCPLHATHCVSTLFMALRLDVFLALAAICVCVVSYFLILLYKARSEFYHTKVKKGLPMPPWHPIFGHLLVLNDAFNKYKLPPDIQMPDTFAHFSKTFDQESDSLFYMDLWPFIKPLVLVSSPKYALQACQQNHQVASDRPDDLLWSLHPVTGGPSVFATNGSP